MTVNLTADKIQTGVIRRDPAASAAKMGVENFVSRFCVAAENPCVKRDWLLRRMDTLFILAFVALHDRTFYDTFSLTHPIPHKAKQANTVMAVCGGNLTIAE